jgi:uncharacterized RDD family membrane protein YckC
MSAAGWAGTCPGCGAAVNSGPSCENCGHAIFQTVTPERPETPEHAGFAPPTMSPRVFEPKPEPTFAGREMASWGYRVGAFLVDLGLVLGAGFAVGALGVPLGWSESTAETVGFLVMIGVWVLNTSVVVGVTGGQSLGKRLAGTRIVHESGTRIGFGVGFLRDTICRLLFFIPLIGLVDSLMPLGREHQSMRDKMVGTRVLREPVYRSRRWLLTLAAVLVTAGWVAFTAAADMWEEPSTSAAPGNGYQAIDRDAFISGCRDEGGGEKTCACAFDYIKARLSYDEYLEADRTTNTSKWPPRVRRVIADAFTKCDRAAGEDPAIGA